MKQLLKHLLYKFAPELTTSIVSAKGRAHSHNVVREWGCGPINQKLISNFGNSVITGPFKDVILTPMTHAEQIGPYLLGVYESELDNSWATILQGTYTQIIDVGAKFGFYAVGLAKKYPQAEVMAFDTDWWARKATREMAAANQTSNVQIKGFCTPQWLTQNIRQDAFIISDCEGFEGVLFSPEVVANLTTSTLIVETHDCFVPGVCDRLRKTFDASHDVEVVTMFGDRRTPNVDLNFLATDRERELASQEVRPDQIWLLCLPRNGSNAGLALQTH
jgi:hypothetical protein